MVEAGTSKFSKKAPEAEVPPVTLPPFLTKALKKAGGWYEEIQDPYFKKFWDITREYDELDLMGSGPLLAISVIDSLIHHTKIEGDFPPVGTPAIFVGNHDSGRNPVKATRAFIGKRAFFTPWTHHETFNRGRTIRCFVRDSLLYPTIQEDPAILALTGKAKNDLDAAPMFFKQIRAKMMRDEGSIPIPRGADMPITSIRIALAAIDHGDLVASFLQQTRIPQGDLRDLFEGAAFLAIKRPDCLVIPVGNASHPDIFKMGPGFTYNQARGVPGFTIDGLSETQRLTIYMADQTAFLLHQPITERWYTSQRDSEITRFRTGNKYRAIFKDVRLKARKATIEAKKAADTN
jgi:hypothetical protein